MDREITDQVWAERLGRLREEEWTSAMELTALGRKVMDRAKRLAEGDDFPKAAVAQAVTLLDDASKFGRRAVEGVKEPPAPTDVRAELLTHLSRNLEALYGRDGDGA